MCFELYNACLCVTCLVLVELIIDSVYTVCPEKRDQNVFFVISSI